MAHIEKYKAHSVGHMLAHYRRDSGAMGRENIDRGRTHLNQTLGPKSEPGWSVVRGRIEAVDAKAAEAGRRRTRSDAVVMADLVVTLPEDVRDGDENAFFEACYSWLAAQVGEANMLGGFIHRDEVRADGSAARDHMHAAFTPIRDGRFNYKSMCPRSFYQAMHKGLGDAAEARLGYRPAIELGEAERATRVYASKARDVEKVRAAVDAAIVAPAEARAAEAERAAAAALSEEEAAQQRLECLQGEARELEREVRELERRADELERERDELAARVEKLWQVVRRARDAVIGAARAASGAVREALGLAVDADSDPALCAAQMAPGRPESCRVRPADGLEVLMKAAIEAATRGERYVNDNRSVRELHTRLRGR